MNSPYLLMIHEQKYDNYVPSAETAHDALAYFKHMADQANIQISLLLNEGVDYDEFVLLECHLYLCAAEEQIERIKWFLRGKNDMKKGDRVYARDLTKDLGFYKLKLVRNKYGYGTNRYKPVIDFYIKSEVLLSNNGYIGICDEIQVDMIRLKHKPNHIVDLEEVKTI